VFNPTHDWFVSMTIARGRTIKIFLIDATSSGMRLTEASGWTGSCLDFSRPDYPRARERLEVCRSGVYILVGPNDGPSSKSNKVYVGEADMIKTRLDLHQKEKEFWNRAFVFSNKDNSLNKAHVRYLEAALINRLQDVNRAEIDNSTSPEQRGLSESEVADMQSFLDEILLLLPVLGVHDFDLVSVPPVASPGSVDLERTDVNSSTTTVNLRFKLNEKKAYAEGRDGTQGFIVSKGAYGPATVGVMTPSYNSIRGALIEDGSILIEGDQADLVRDTLFGSPSAAASVVTGGSRNGMTSWKDDSGRTLGAIRNSLAED